MGCSGCGRKGLRKVASPVTKGVKAFLLKQFPKCPCGQPASEVRLKGRAEVFCSECYLRALRAAGLPQDGLGQGEAG